MPPVRLPFTVPAVGRRCDIVGFGLNSVDLLAVVAEYPASDTKQRLQRFARLPGGQTATALVTCARLGWRASYIGSFGDDELGGLSRDSLVDEGVDVAGSRVVAGATNEFAIILVDARTGERTVLWDRPPALMFASSDVDHDMVTAGRMLIVDGLDTAAAAEAARVARRRGIPTVIDIERVRPGTADLLANVDAIIAATEFPALFTGYDDLGRALAAIGRESGAAVVCVTLGREGSLTWSCGREMRTPAYPVDCVDSTGAGDAFRGGFAAACLRSPDGDLEDVLRYANAVAALNCRALGARGAIPRPGEVEQLLMARP
jgi:sugar/nucleoside kinase (ribokinase family)